MYGSARGVKSYCVSNSKLEQNSVADMTEAERIEFARKNAKANAERQRKKREAGAEAAKQQHIEYSRNLGK